MTFDQIHKNWNLITEKKCLHYWDGLSDLYGVTSASSSDVTGQL